MEDGGKPRYDHLVCQGLNEAASALAETAHMLRNPAVGQNVQQQGGSFVQQLQPQGGVAVLQHHQSQQQRLQNPQPQAPQVPKGVRPCTNAMHDPSKGGDPAARCSYSHAHWSAPALRERERERERERKKERKEERERARARE